MSPLEMHDAPRVIQLHIRHNAQHQTDDNNAQLTGLSFFRTNDCVAACAAAATIATATMM